jgi:competence protein ComEA
VPELSPRTTTALAVGALVAAVAGGWYFGRSPGPASLLEPPQTVTSAVVIVAHVSGAVADPGLVSLTEPARVADAIEAAGGAIAGADLEAINLAGAVHDGDQILVPVIGEQGAAPGGLIDLNRATAQQLSDLQGIGPVLADRIVTYREEHGPFQSVEDLLDVPGIGEAKLAMLRAGVAAP